MAEVIFGTCNHLFRNKKLKKPLFNLVTIYPEETKADFSFLGDVNVKPKISTILYGPKPPQRPPRLKKPKAAKDENHLDPTLLLPQISIEEKTILCCLPRSFIQAHGDKKENSKGEEK